MPYWTTGEIRRFKQAHVGARPTCAFMYGMFPRHTESAVSMMGSKLGLRHPVIKPIPHIKSHLRWLVIAHRYFEGRDIEKRM